MSWHARMVASDEEFDGSPLLRREFQLEEGHGRVSSAELTLSALGVVEAYVNGVSVSGHLLTPGWSSYEWRVRYSTLDVAGLLEQRSVLGLALGNGWYRGRLAWGGCRAIYGEELGGFAELTITYEDGYVQRVVTDSSWTAGPSAVLANDLYDGETIDARRIDSGWMHAGFAEEGWTGVHELDFDTSLLTSYLGPPVSRRQELPARAVWRSASGATLVDFGQNLVGFVRVRVKGPAGTEITLRHAEVLEHGELGTRPLRSALATDRFVLSGTVDEFEPTFTFHGFRYAEITGWPGDVDPAALTAVVIGSELERIGTFTCSDDLLNQFHQNVVWGMRGNFIDVPTDCPQRDERLGWTGDIAAFAPTAAFLFDVTGFLSDWLRDVEAEQSHAAGMIPFVVPDVLKYLPHPPEFPNPESTAIWSDAGVWVPWALWKAYGDRRVLERQFDSMAAHVRRVESLLSPEGLWDTGFQFGDWLDPDAPSEDPAAAKADKGVVATASAFRSATLVAKAAEVLGREHDQQVFEEIARHLREAFNKHYVDGGRVRSDCTTVYALSIVFDLLEAGDELIAGHRLAELARDAGYRISTGFAGTPFILDALTRTGHVDVAYRLLTEKGIPSWLYPVTMGATTVWERWDSMLPDGTINLGEMTSFNHYALGAVADWMHRTVGGIVPVEPGYARALIAPIPGGGITSARTSLRTPHGRLAVEWSISDGVLLLHAEIPQGVEAMLRLPSGQEQQVLGGTHDIREHLAAATA